MESQNILLEKKQWVRLTKVCNDNCIFCLDKDNLNGTLVSPEEIRSILSHGIKQGAKRAVLSGGEPTLHPDFHGIVCEAKETGYKKVQVVTNGRMFAYKRFLENALDAGLSEITFSIPSHKAEDHDALTQVKGSYLQTMAGLRNALENGRVIVSMDIVVTKMNIPYLTEMLEFFIQFGVTEFDVLYPRPFGAAWENKKDVLFSVEEALPFLEDVFKMSRRKDVKIWANKFPERYMKNFPELVTPEEKIWSELYSREEFSHFKETGEAMWCFGERCGSCFFKPACHGILKAFDKNDSVRHRGAKAQRDTIQNQVSVQSKSEIVTCPQREEKACIPA